MPLPDALTDIDKPIIGMVHLDPLPGSPRFDGDFDAVIARAVADAEALAAGGVHAVMIENFGDAPFFPRRVEPVTVAAMTRIVTDVRRAIDLPVGVNVLRNDGCAALAVAVATGATGATGAVTGVTGGFIRVNVLCGARVTDQGVIEGIAAELLRDRARLRAEHVRIFADVDVKHSAPLGPPRALADEVADTIHRGGADAVIVSGVGTGKATDPAQVTAVKQAAGDTPVLIGSGLTADNAAALLAAGDGAIVGSAFKRDGDATQPVDPQRVAALMQAIR